MKMHYSALGDFVPANFAVPQNPVMVMKPNGLGEFVPGWFVVPQNPLRGLNGMGCGCGGGCGHCGGLGQVDLSFSGTGIMSSIGTTLGTTSLATIPNWAVYGVGALFAYFALFQTHPRYSRRRLS
jgi:hypothetical protein